MEIDISELLKLQQQFDTFLHNNHNIKDPKEMFCKRKLALAVEICELANEIKSFKFWSVNKKISKQKIGDEFADVLHFVFSLFNYLKGEKTKYQLNNHLYSDNQITHKFIKLLKIATHLKTKKDCELFLDNFFDLSYSLGLNKQDIFEFYKTKNLINIQRQIDKY